jgi:hypothetical protein
MKTTIARLTVLGCLALPASEVAQSSTFSTSDDGWTLGELFNVTGGTAPSLWTSGGNPGGFVRAVDIFEWNALWAPAAYLGDKSATYGSTLSFDMRVGASDGAPYPMVVISDGTTTLQYMAAPPTTTWTSFIVPLTESGWQWTDGSGNSGAAASRAQFQQVLGNLALLHLDADWPTGGDAVDLDNVRLGGATTAAPEPATLRCSCP